MDWYEALKNLPAKEVYQDLAQPATREVGKALGNAAKVARFVLAPVDYLAAHHERWERYLERVASKVPDEQRIEAAPQLAGPIFEGLRYVDEHSLHAELFVNLLARAIDRNRVNEAHPAFVQLISELSPDEAVILLHLKQKPFKQVVRSNIKMTPAFGGRFVERLYDEYPVRELVFPGNFDTYIEHLHSLNLAGVLYQGQSEPIVEGDPPQEVGHRLTQQLVLRHFGEMFAAACVPDNFHGITACEPQH